MVNIFYKSTEKVLLHQGIQGLDDLLNEEVIWVDLIAPSPIERDSIEKFFNITLQTQQEIEEIEISSRYFETQDVIIANTQFLILGENDFRKESVSFIIKEKMLFSYRYAEMRTFNDMYRRLDYHYRIIDGVQIFLTLLEIRIDLDADMIENVVKDISAISTLVIREKHMDEEMLVKISNYQELTMMLRENVIDKQRVISSIMKSEYFPPEHQNKLRIMVKDTSSILDYTSFSFQRLDFLQNSFVGFVNIEQNKIIKIFTVATVVFMPPTLIASIYGMNFKFLPETQWTYGYPFAIVLMIIASLGTVYFFKKKKWL
ncbi:MAG: magnesium and cobalt transport protein CorA [Firmicutes bacterium HGW-Firmicutes-17]|jgi:magnesium transporter|nr:MAG: magnesium and cobalt transport protein CorA [Firmicutes bacterium HGW-Firmicutes-17]